MLGAAPKDYLAYGDRDAPDAFGYIAKCPRLWGPRECVTEEIISTIGRLLPLKVARSKLVRLPPGVKGVRGVDDVRFMSRDFLGRDERLRHGVELFADYMGTSRSALDEVFHLGDRREERKFYTLENAVIVLKWSGRTPSCSLTLTEAFARMLAFDALVGSQDRHAENWGIIENVKDEEVPRRFAPVFDSARGLFATYSDEVLVRDYGKVSAAAREAAIRRYANHSRPVFGCAKGRGRVNHFELMDYALSNFKDSLAGPICQVVTAFDPEKIWREIRKRFKNMISPIRLELILRLLEYRRERMKEVVECSR